MNTPEPFTFETRTPLRPKQLTPLTNDRTRQTTLFDAGREDLPGQTLLFSDIATQDQPEPSHPQARRFSIVTARRLMDELTYSVRGATGGTGEENARTNLPEVIRADWNAVRALQMPARFERDAKRRFDLITSTEATLKRWNDNQTDTSRQQ